MTEALQRARGGGGATFIEARTVRWPGNRPIWPQLLTGESNLAMAWDESLIPDEHRIWHTKQDAVLGFIREIVAAGLIEPDGIMAMDDVIRADMKAGVEFALESDYPQAESAMDLVLA
jgi:TPP-dependent pyruvate/acetoin dehydrogenase alpha subunit